MGRYFPLGLLCGRASERFGASVNEERRSRAAIWPPRDNEHNGEEGDFSEGAIFK